MEEKRAAFEELQHELQAPKVKVTVAKQVPWPLLRPILTLTRNLTLPLAPALALLLTLTRRRLHGAANPLQ